MLNLGEFRSKMNWCRTIADSDSKRLKEPYIALDELSKLYEKFNYQERQMANQVLSEWVLSEDEGIRFDALVLIDDYKVAMAVPALKDLMERLSSSNEPGAPYELKKVKKILARLVNYEFYMP